MNSSKEKAFLLLWSVLQILGGSGPGMAFPQDKAPPTEAVEAPSQARDAVEASDPEAESEPSAKAPESTGTATSSDTPTESEPDVEPVDSDLTRLEVTESGPWIQRVEEISEDILRGELDHTAADALLGELKPELKSARDRMRESLSSGSTAETRISQHQAMEDLYDARLLLLEEISPILGVRLTSLGADGVREAGEEWDRLQLHMRYQIDRVPDKASVLGKDLRTSPIPILQAIVSLVVVVVLFRIWRRWATKALPAMRQSLLTARPRSRRNIRFAKALWYLDRLRGPIEWLILLGVIASVIRPSSIFQEEDPILAIIKWIVIGWLGLRFVDAVASRGGAGLAKDDSGLRLRSLKLLWGWIALFGLGLDLAREYVGEGTLFAWTWKGLLAVGFVVVVILVHWWRDEVFARLTKEPDPPAWIQRLLIKNKDRKAYLATAMGGGYLLLRGLRRRILRFFSDFEIGRRVLAHIFRQEVERQAEAQKLAVEGDPLPDHLQERLLTGGEVVSKAHREQKRAILELAEGESGWFIALVGERGLGKSALLRRLGRDLGDRMLVVDCPITGFQDLRSALKSGIGLSADPGLRMDGLRVALNERGIDILAIDNVHRVSSPRIGGLEDFEQLLGLVRGLGRGISWIFALDSVAWQYIRSARSGASGNTSVVTLDNWSEEEISELMNNSAAAAGIEPSFDRLVLPRQLDEMAYEAESDRKQHGFSRILWYASDGNPGVALRHWKDSLRVRDNGQVAVHLFPQRSVEDLEDLNLTNQFILRSLAQMEYATIEDVLEATRLEEGDVRNAIRGLLVRGLVEKKEGMLHLSWNWYRMITRMLRRQNLLAVD